MIDPIGLDILRVMSLALCGCGIGFLVWHFCKDMLGGELW